jgi:hypothetical protein
MDFASAKCDVADAFAANELYQDNGRRLKKWQRPPHLRSNTRR